MKTISIIVPVYNGEKTLDKCIKSILNQTYEDFELILVNDGSIDNSLKICEKYALNDKRIKIISQENKGIVSARKKGIENSTGEYIIFVDSDDWIDLKMVDKLYNKAIQSKSDIVVCKKCKVLNLFDFIKKDMNSSYDYFYSIKNTYEKEEIKNIIVKSFLFSGCFPIEVWARIYKRNLFESMGKYTSKIHFFAEDLYLNFELFLKAKKVTLLNETLYYYRVGGGSSKYKKYYFEDIVYGIEEKKKIILEHYADSTDDIFIPLYTNFLELYKSCLFNLMYSNYDEESIKNKIKEQISNKNILEAVAVIKDIEFDKEFISALDNKDIEYLYNISVKNKKRRFIKDKIINFL